MNKQIITFLSLFSLVLVLSIYYITLPNNDLSDPDTVVNVNSSDVDQEFAILQENLSQKHSQIIQSYNSVIASGQATTAEKARALEGVQNTRDLIKMEKELVEMLKEKGYQNAFVEIVNQTVKVTVKSENKSTEEAAKIMKLVLDKISSQYLVEVFFTE